jgi:hypothetical protein
MVWFEDIAGSALLLAQKLMFHIDKYESSFSAEPISCIVNIQTDQGLSGILKLPYGQYDCTGWIG